MDHEQKYDDGTTRWDDGSTTFDHEGFTTMRVEPVERGVRITVGEDGDAADHSTITIHDGSFDRVLEAMLRARRYRKEPEARTGA